MQGLWKHANKPVVFSLFVDDAGIKHGGKHSVYHLLAAHKEHHPITTDRKWSTYCGLTLK